MPSTAEEQLAILKEDEFRPLAGEFADQQLAEAGALAPDKAREMAAAEHATGHGGASMAKYLNRLDGREQAERELGVAASGVESAEVRQPLQDFLNRDDVREKYGVDASHLTDSREMADAIE